MQRTFPAARIVNYRARQAGCDGIAPSDRHVVAAALAARARYIVTRNLKHFPAPALAALGPVEAVHPDAFLVVLHDRAGVVVEQAVHDWRKGLKRPSFNHVALCDKLAALDLPAFAECMRGWAHARRASATTAATNGREC